MKSIKQIIFMALVIVTSACNDYIDVVPDNVATLDNAFALRNEAEKYLFTCYSYLPRHGSADYNPAFFGGDELIPGRDYANGINPHYLITGRQGISTVYMDFWGGYNGGQMQRNNEGGKGAYDAIRDCNIFLENIGRVPDMTEEERQRWIAEVEFLKAYYHFWLVKQYGPIIIVDKNLPIDAGIEEVKQFRNTLDECFDYIVGLFDKVIANEYLPNKITNEAEELGRVTRMIAKAVRCEVLINRASPLFNGNTFYTGMKDKRDIEIFNPNKSEDEKRQRWIEARDACLDAIQFAEGLGHKLYYYIPGEYPGLSEETLAKLNIRMAVTDKWNTEVIWGDANSWVGTQGKDLSLHSLPRDLDPNKIKNTTQRNNYAVPIKIAEQFYSKNGVPITEDKTWNYIERYKLRQATENEKYLIKEGETTCQLNFDREIRYYASVGFDRGIWFGQGKTDDNTCYFVQGRFGEPAANSVQNSWNYTGLWPKKLVHFETVISEGTSGQTAVEYPFPIIRLSSLYLWYAEALNESGETDINKIFEYVDKVRERASLKGVEESWKAYSTNSDKLNTLTGRREIIQQERLIEFAFEGQRYWDMRRWLRAHTEFPKPLTGWNLKGETAEDYYNETTVDITPVFKIKNYFTPLSETEMKRNTNLLQNYGW